MADNRRFVQSQEFKLAIGINAGATSVRIKDLLDIDGTVLTMSRFGTKGFGTLEPNSSREEQISWTGITDNGDDTYTLTGVSTVAASTAASPAAYTETSGVANNHVGGSVFIVSNTPAFYDSFVSKTNDETITGANTHTGVNTINVGTAAKLNVDSASYVQTADVEYVHKKFTDDTYVNAAGDTMSGALAMGTNKITGLGTPTANTDAATKAYVDGVAIAGVSDASETTKGIVEEATLAETRAGTATGATGAKLFVTPTKLKSSGALGVVSPNAGETINGATLPVPVYQNKTDNEVYSCDANDVTKTKFIGFAITNSTNGNAIDVQVQGVVSGFTGLAEGEKYYVQDTVGTIDTTPGTLEILVGVAISTTELVIQKGSRYYNGVGTFSADGTSDIDCGFRPSLIKMTGYLVDSDGTGVLGSWSSGSWTPAGYASVYWQGKSSSSVVATSTSYILNFWKNSQEGWRITITSVDDTGFTISADEVNTSNDVFFVYEVYGEL